MKKKAPTLRLKAVYEGAAMRQELENMRRAQQTFADCGLDIEAEKMQQKITKMNISIKHKVEEALQQRAMLIREMLLCFAAGDIATTCADKVEEIFSTIAFGQDAQGGKAIAELFHMQAEEWNRCVQMVDGHGENEQVSMYYADMAEEVVSTTIPIIYEIIDKYMKSQKGQRLL